mgnify:CR=1 FL=1
MKYNSYTLKKAEKIIDEAGYVLRYEKGNFNSGYCVLLDKNVIIVNKYFTADVKFQKLLDILQTIEVKETTELTEVSLKILMKLRPDLKNEIPIPFDDGE